MTAKKAYNFTSVGAFTTVHTNKPTHAISIDQLMLNDKQFKFKTRDLIDFGDESPDDKLERIENEILVNFYALKLFIELGSDLKQLNDNMQANSLVPSLKSKLKQINSCIIEGYHKILNQYAQSVRVEQKQKFFNLNEKLLYYKLKFESFLKELSDFEISYNQAAFKEFLTKFISNIIEFYVSLPKFLFADLFRFSLI